MEQIFFAEIVFAKMEQIIFAEISEKIVFLSEKPFPSNSKRILQRKDSLDIVTPIDKVSPNSGNTTMKLPNVYWKSKSHKITPIARFLTAPK